MKKNQEFINPAATYIGMVQNTAEKDQVEPDQQETTPQGLPNFKKREKRTARISLLLKTSTANKLRERAAVAGTTLNDYLNYVLDELTKE